VITHTASTAVLKELTQRQVRWALLRSPAEETSTDGDIDLLVHPSDMSVVRDVFLALGFLSLPRAGTHFLSYDASTDVWLWFHVVDALSFLGGQVETDAAEACLARRLRCEPIRLAPDDAFWVLLLHCALDKRAVAPRHRSTLQQLAAPEPLTGPMATFMANFCALEPTTVTPQTLVQMVATGEWTGVEQTMWKLADQWRRRHRPPFLRRRRDEAKSYAAALKRAIYSPGLSVALLGPDGAGKSTLATGIAASFKLPVSIMYMGLTGGFLQRVAKLRIPGVVFVGRALVIWRRYLRARLHQARGRLVVFDRYIFDAFVPHPRRLNVLERLSRRLNGYLCPAPDLVLILDAPGDLMHVRKGEYDGEMLEDWRRHFLALQQRIPDIVEVIDATQDKEAVRRDATQRIWRRYRARQTGQLTAPAVSRIE
jgi:thymidylate kinase